MNRHFNLSIASFIASATVLGALSSPASAMSFVPNQQGEINVGLGCLDDCIDVDPIFESIISLTDTTTQSRSRLFVDYFGQGDQTQSFGNGKVVLSARDTGTNADGFWFRPSEYTVDTGENEEQGQLEVGTYLFNLSQELAELTVDYFDTESANTTGILAINGQTLDQPDYVARGGDSNLVSQTFTNVSSFVLKLGYDREQGTGDGVDFRLSGEPATSVPEPASILGLLAIAGSSVLLKKSAA